MLMEHIENIAQWHVYLIIDNLSQEIRKSRVRPRGMMVALIPIPKSDSHGVKIEIYHQTMRVITKSTCNYRPTNIIDGDLFLCLALVTLG